MAELSVYDDDPTLYLFTSLTAGSSHIVTATSRIETILKANKIPFKGVDTATDELARKLYGRRARGKKLPLLVKEGYVIADLEQVEEWNEYDELKEALGATSAPAPAPAPAKSTPAPAPAVSAAVDQKENEPSVNPAQNLAIRQLGAEAANVAAAKKHVPEKISTTNPLLASKVNSPAVGTPTKGSDKTDTSSILSPRSIPLPATPVPTKATDKTDTSSVLSPRSIPLPATPGLSSPTAAQPTTSIPKISSKPVHAPPSMHVDAANPDLAAAPISSTTAPSPTSSRPSPRPLSSGSTGSGVTSPQTSFHGRNLGSASQEEIRQIEKEQSITEVTSSEEGDSEDDEEEEEEDEKKDADKADKAPVKQTVPKDVETDKKGEKTQEQSAKVAEKTGDSVED